MGDEDRAEGKGKNFETKKDKMNSTERSGGKDKTKEEEKELERDRVTNKEKEKERDKEKDGVRSKQRKDSQKEEFSLLTFDRVPATHKKERQLDTSKKQTT